MNRICLLVIVLLVAPPALAFDANKLGQGGSLPLSDLDPLIGQSSRLKQEIGAALAALKKTAGDVNCVGNRFPSAWIHLGGMRAAPYTCDFSGKWLVIDATVRVTDRAGKAYDTITKAAMQNVVKVAETNPAWKWTTEDPFKDDK